MPKNFWPTEPVLRSALDEILSEEFSLVTDAELTAFNDSLDHLEAPGDIGKRVPHGLLVRRLVRACPTTQREASPTLNIEAKGLVVGPGCSMPTETGLPILLCLQRSPSDFHNPARPAPAGIRGVGRGCRSMDSIFPYAALASIVKALSAAVRLRQRISDAARGRRAARQLEVRDRYCRGR